MKPWHGCLLGLAVLAMAGCQTSRNIAALEQELRLQEDRIYRLQDCLEGAELSLAACREENDALRAASRASAGTSGTTPRRPAGVPEVVPDIPKVELPTEDGFKAKPPASLRGIEPPASPKPTPPDSEAPRWKPSQGDSTPPAPSGGNASQAEPVEEISLGDVTMTLPENGSGGGDAGLSIVLQTFDAKGRPVAAAAPVSVVAVDPSVAGPSGRVARWDFSAEDVAARRGRGGSGEGVRLALPWPSGPPARDALHLFVRWMAPDGRKLQTEMPIELGRLARATPAAPSRTPGELPRTPGESPRSISSWDLPEPPPISPAEPPASDRPSVRSVPSRDDAAPLARRPRRPVWSPERP